MIPYRLTLILLLLLFLSSAVSAAALEAPPASSVASVGCLRRRLRPELGPGMGSSASSCLPSSTSSEASISSAEGSGAEGCAGVAPSTESVEAEAAAEVVIDFEAPDIVGEWRDVVEVLEGGELQLDCIAIGKPGKVIAHQIIRQNPFIILVYNVKYVRILGQSVQ